jgi:hypothetical protein
LAHTGTRRFWQIGRFLQFAGLSGLWVEGDEFVGWDTVDLADDLAIGVEV